MPSAKTKTKRRARRLARRQERERNERVVMIDENERAAAAPLPTNSSEEEIKAQGAQCLLAGMPSNVLTEILLFLTPPEMDRVRALCRTLAFSSAYYKTACLTALELHQRGAYAASPRAVAACLPRASLELLRPLPAVLQAAKLEHHPLENSVAPSLEASLRALSSASVAGPASEQETTSRELLGTFASRRGTSLARALMGVMMKQWTFSVKDPFINDWSHPPERYDDAEKTPPVSDLDGCLLNGITRGGLGKLLKRGDIVRIIIQGVKHKDSDNNSEDENNSDYEEEELTYYEEEEKYRHVTCYVCVRITEYQRRSGHGREGVFAGIILPALLEPMALRMVLPGDPVWFRRRDVVQIPLAMNERLRESWRPLRQLAIGRFQMTADLGHYDPRPAPSSWCAEEAESLMACWGDSRALHPSGRAFAGPGNVVCACVGTQNENDEGNMFVGEGTCAGLDIWRVLAVDPQDSEYFFGQLRSPGGWLPNGLVIRMPRSAIFEIPMEGWNPGEFLDFVRRDEEQPAVTRCRRHDRDNVLVDVGNPTGWDIPGMPRHPV